MIHRKKPTTLASYLELALVIQALLENFDIYLIQLSYSVKRSLEKKTFCAEFVKVFRYKLFLPISLAIV